MSAAPCGRVLAAARDRHRIARSLKPRAVDLGALLPALLTASQPHLDANITSQCQRPQRGCPLLERRICASVEAPLGGHLART